MATSQVVRLTESVRMANEATAAETVRVTTAMTEQCKRLTELGREFVKLCETDPLSLSEDACGDLALLIAKRREAIREAINELATQPVVTLTWAKAYINLYGAESPFSQRYREWCEHQQAEQERQERATEYRRQLHQEQALHERRLRGEAV